ncbi:MAG TPA: dihydroorotase [Candidatus Thalassarchaeaceae archaeon]|jgi:dihydroorotase|nr:dihydroorotase [Candidatus Thalassarchaeaceae archaeon]|tara:strand:- start:40590 stop:41963 length:1374 start_codon:yes stop_codon:yes gene_type:complete
MDNSLLFQNAELVFADSVVCGDLRTTAGKIAAVAPGGGLTPRDGEAVIDADGLHLLPGAIDPQVHFREPGQTEKEDIGSGSFAAASGGVTSFLDMPNNVPSAISMDAIKAKISSASVNSVTHHGFFIGATPNNIEELQDAVGTPENPNPTDGICGIKIFMGSSTGDLLVDEQSALEEIFAGTGGVIAVHAEDEGRLNQRRPEFEGRTDVAAHAEWRDSETALIATKRACKLADESGHRLHVLHLTSGLEANWLATNKSKNVTTEVCPQHLTFDQEDVEERGTRLVMNPPIRYSEDRETLWSRLKDGTIDCIATDHAPHTLENKSLGFPKSHSGMPGVETSLPVMLTHAADGKCSIPDVVKWMCEGPAEVYGIQGKGRLEEGRDADLVLVDMGKRRAISDTDTWTRVGWTAYEGIPLTGWPVGTFVDGRMVFNRTRGGSAKGSILVEPGTVGRALRFS